MKDIDAEMRAKLDAGATTLAWCWRLTRADGHAQGLTDHDRDIVFDSTTFEAATGFSASEIRDAVGLGVDNLDVSGGLSSASLSEADLNAGLYDDAKVEIFRVDWEQPEHRILMRTGSLGEVRRSGGTFTAEIRGLAHYLQAPNGRLFQYACDADLGDRRCSVDLDDAAYSADGAIIAVHSRRKYTVGGLAAFADDWFTRGTLRITTGPAAGQASEVRLHRVSAGGVTVELWRQPGTAPEAGDAFHVTAGCDKHFATCKAKFANTVNFRGFPHMPGNDFVGGYVRPRG